MSIRRLALLAFCVLLAACSKVTQENYQKLSAGMAKAEVESLLGKPTDCSGALGMSSCTWGDKNSLPLVMCFFTLLTVCAFTLLIRDMELVLIIARATTLRKAYRAETVLIAPLFSVTKPTSASPRSVAFFFERTFPPFRLTVSAKATGFENVFSRFPKHPKFIVITFQKYAQNISKTYSPSAFKP